MGQYDDIIKRERPIFPHYKHMSMRERAAQFMPFAALTGYEECIEEAGRFVDVRRSLSEARLRVLNERLDFLRGVTLSRPAVLVEYFVADPKKEGGIYRTRQGRIRRVDYDARCLVFEDRTTIAFDDIYRLEGLVFESMPQGDFL